MSSNSTMDNIFLGIQTVLAAAPVPGIAVIGIALQELYKIARNIAQRQQECHALIGYAAQVSKVLFDHWQPAHESELEPAIEDVKSTISDMNLDMIRWRNYGKSMGYLKNNEIMEGVRKHRANLDRALNMVHLAGALEQQTWNEEFKQAQSRDHELLQTISERQDQMNGYMEDLQRKLATVQLQAPPAYSSTADAVPPPSGGPDPRSAAKDQLYKLRTVRQDTAVLPFRDLTAEIEKTGQRPVHAGSMYDIWKGIWLEENLVALRVHRGQSPSDREMERLTRQVDLWMSLDHENILKLYGICHPDRGSSPPTYFVSPWMKNRDVMNYLSKHPTSDRMKLLHDVAKGLQYLHSVNILHGGLQGSNVLIDDSGNAVLSDFSLSKVMDPNLMFTHSNGPQSSLRWMAPEAHNQQLMSNRTDVYSWGMTALQIISGRVPYHTTRAVGRVVIAIAIKNAKPERADYIDASPLLQNDRLWNLFEACWITEPEKRPSVDEVLAEVAALRGIDS